jgi:DnaK suppressor protein
MATKKKSARKAKRSARTKAKKKAPAKKRVAAKKQLRTKKKAAKKKVARKKLATKRSAKKTALRKAPAKKAARKKAPGRVTRNAAFFEHFRQRLLAEREQIRKRLEELQEELSGLDETPREMEEWAQEEKDRDILIRLEERETDELRKIQAALTLIDQKEYGRCQVCGRPIPRARLEELPTAFRCVDCTP